MRNGTAKCSWRWQSSPLSSSFRQQPHLAWTGLPAACGSCLSLSLRSSVRHTGAERAAITCAAVAQDAPPPQPPLLRPLQPHPVQLTANGLVPNTASLDAVPPQLLPLLDAAVAACQRHLGARLAGVYLRGSLVHGGFLPGTSDADFVALYVETHREASTPSEAGVAAELQQAAARLQHQFPQCVKVELKSVALPAGSPLAQRWLRRDCIGAHTAIPPSALLDQAGLAFQLKSQAVCLHGWDLPRLLPDVAALPPLQLLPALLEDVEAAAQRAQQWLAAAAQATSGSGSIDLEAASRAVRWALKRCIRAAAELQLVATSDGGGARVYSRDLFFCLQYAAQACPELAQQLRAGLEVYVALAAADMPAGERRRLAGEGVALARQVGTRLDRMFLQQMLTPEPGWLTHHHSTGGIRSRSRSSSSSRGGGAEAGSGSWPAWQAARVSLWAALASSSRGGGLEDELVGAPPPPVTAARVAGAVLTLDWRQPAARQQAAAIIAATMTAAADPAALLARDARSSSSSSSSSVPPQPVLLKGAAAHWPAVRRWTLASLAAAGLEGRARLAPSLQFPFTEPRLAGLLAAQQGGAALPTCVARMTAAEFAARMQRGNPCALPPLVYGSSGGGGQESRAGEAAEYYYFQAELPPRLLPDIDLASPPFAAPACGGPAPQLRPTQTQAARVWVGPQGAISPTHYDLGHSFLTQVKGRKRMLFWSPDQLPALYCYADTHLLRRRSRLNMHGPPAQQQQAQQQAQHQQQQQALQQAGEHPSPLAERAGTVVEAVLEPGDVIFFPSRWAHYTESLDFSMSVTCRFQAASSE